MKSVFIAVYCVLTGWHLPLNATSAEFEKRIQEAELAGNRTQVVVICKEWYASGQYSPGLLNWNYNALMSVEQGALLFTQQESDTYPALLLQYALDVRPDVQVISFQWLENQEYRSLMVDREALSWIPKKCSRNDFIAQLLNPNLSKNAAVRPVYFGSMTHNDLLQADKEKLYLTGLALKYSLHAFDNVATLRYNFENRFRKDYLELSFEPEIDPAGVARVNLNYIPALLLLHRHYTAAGEPAKAVQLQNMALQIARTGGREKEVRAFFEPERSGIEIVSLITPKVLDRAMKKVSDKLYAAETELTNGQYEQFLTDLLKNKDYEQLNLCKMAKTDWIALLPKDLQHLPAAQIFKHGHPDSPECPVQNISHEAAMRYCAWITRVYNDSPEKKKFKKVLFRLPTEAEWMTAARGGQGGVYPWPGGYYVQNSKGCYLGNYNTTEPCGDCPDQTLPASATLGADISYTKKVQPTDQADLATLALGALYDGGFFAVPADSYYPNKFGLYAMSGNVAEMILEADKTKGGSWQDIPYYGQIQTVKIHNEPSPAVGFRVFMEVIEE